MEVDYAFLADAADVPPGGKLYAHGGGFDEIRAFNFPAVHPHMALVVKLKLHPMECNRQHKLEIELWDQDGQRIGPTLNADFSAQRNANDPTRSVFVQLVMNIFGLQFSRPGSYAFHVVVNEERKKEIPLYLIQLEKAERSDEANRLLPE